MEQTNNLAILLATYNGEAYLREQIASLEAQTAGGWTVYFHDDGSTDGTMDIIRSYTEADPDRFRYVDGPATGGAKTNFFYLLGQVEAPYYFFCDQDDIWDADKVEVTHRRMREIEERDSGQWSVDSGQGAVDRGLPCLVFTELRVVNADGSVLAERMSDYQALDCTSLGINRMLIQNVVTGCTMEINRALRERMLAAKGTDGIIMHDWWAALIASLYGRMAFLPRPTICYRQHDANSVGALAIHSRQYLAKRMRQGAMIRESLAKTRHQAAVFVRTFGLPEDSLAARYAHCGEWWKGRRMAFYWRYGIRKTGLGRRIGFVIWG